MFISFGTPSSIREITKSIQNPSVLRSRHRILAIDDQGFPMREILSTHGFIVVEMDDLKAIEMAHPYQIVICDIRGVGRHFGGRHEGAHLFKEIRKMYPDKYIISSTAYKFNPTYNEYFKSADTSVQKDADSETWVSILDRAIEVMSDPAARWLRARKYLLDEVGIDLWYALRIEEALVKAIKAREREVLDSTIQRIAPSHDIKNLLEAFAKSLFSDIAANAIVAAAQ